MDLVVQAVAETGLRVERTPADVPGDLVIGAPLAAPQALLRVLAAAAPHPRGGRGSLGLHWLLHDTPADFVAVVDLSRRRGWLIPTADFRTRAQPLARGRFHLDWIVVPLPRARASVPAEHEFERYMFERALPRLARELP